MKRAKSIAQAIGWKIVVIAMCQSILLAAVWLGAEYRQFRKHVAEQLEKYEKSQRDLVRGEVEGVLGYVSFKRSQAGARIQAELEERVDEALAVADRLQRATGGRQAIRSALAAMSPDRGRGHLFVLDRFGLILVDGKIPRREGSDRVSEAGAEGGFMAREVLAACRREGQGTLRFRERRPGGGEAAGPSVQVAHFRAYPTLGWIVGAVMSEEDMTFRIQQEILSRVASIRFDVDRKNYIFVVSYDGVTLMNDTQRHLIGKNIWDMSDPNGVKVIQEERRAAEKGGDFIRYAWEKPGTSQVVPKISYVNGIPDWRWMIGAGVYLDQVGAMRGRLHRDMRSEMLRRMQWIALLMVLTALAGFAVAAYASFRLRLAFRDFGDFFAKAAHGSARLDTARMPYAEMRDMADSANLMISRRDAAEEARQAETERLDVTLRSIGEAVVTTDCSGRIALFNSIAETLCGCDAARAVGRLLTDVVSFTDEHTRRPLESPLARVLARGETQTAVHNAILHAGSGQERLVSYNAAPIRDHNGSTIGAILVFRDITERQRLDNELNKMQKIESIAVLAGGIAHDFNNLLAAVSGNISLARIDAPESGPIQTFLGKAEAALVRAQELTYQLLTFSKGGNPIQKSLHLDALVRDVVGFSLHGSRAVCALESAPDLLPVYADPGQIGQVIQNIVINADQAMPAGGTIRIGMGNADVDENRFLPLKPGHYVLLTIADQGAGIAPENLKRIFDPFYTTKNQGHGLGLAVVYSIVRKHNGFIDVASEVNAGTTFSIYLPAASALEPEAAAQPDPGLSTGSGRILVMDDEPMVLDLIGNQLRHLGYEPELVRDDREALAVFRREHEAGRGFRVVIMDLTIPGGRGGRELAADVLAIAPGQKLVVTSGYSTDTVMAEFRRFGFHGRLLKPFTLQALAQLLAEVLKPEPEEGVRRPEP